MIRIACLLSLCLAAACGSVSRPGTEHDASTDDIDASPETPPGESREVLGGAGRVSGPTYTLDVQIGHPVSQEPAAGPTHTLEGNAAVKP
jgi:hypothetical protein